MSCQFERSVSLLFVVLSVLKIKNKKKIGMLRERRGAAPGGTDAAGTVGGRDGWREDGRAAGWTDARAAASSGTGGGVFRTQRRAGRGKDALKQAPGAAPPQ